MPRKKLYKLKWKILIHLSIILALFQYKESPATAKQPFPFTARSKCLQAQGKYTSCQSLSRLLAKETIEWKLIDEMGIRLKFNY